jgi:hypothetical protein
MTDEVVVARINGEGVSVREFRRRAVAERGAVFRYFKQAHNVDDNAEFWRASATYAGENPSHVLRSRTLAALVERRVLQFLMRSYGVIDGSDYTLFQRRLLEENQRRQWAAQAGETVYGPIIFDEDGFFEYEFSNNMIELRKRYAERLLGSIKHSELETLFTSVKGTRFVSGTRMEARVYRVRYGDSSQLDRAAGLAAITNVREKLVNSAQPKSSPYISVEEGTYLVPMQTRRITSSLLQGLANLQVKQVSEIIDDGSTYLISQCISRETQYETFDQARDRLEDLYARQHLARLVSSRVRDARIDIVTSVYETITGSESTTNLR